MTVGIEANGKRRQGKSLLMHILGIYFSRSMGVPYLTNDPKTYSKGYGEKLTYKKLLKARNCVIGIDEFWRDIDSRDTRNPRSRFITQWYQLQGHRDIILLYTVQHMSLIDIRIRTSTDYIINCRKRKRNNEIEFRFTIMDGFTGEIISRLKTTEKKIKEFYKIYDYIGSPNSLFNEEEENE